MLWILLLKLELVAAIFFYVMDAILDFIIKTMSKNISGSNTMSGMLIENTWTLTS